MLKKVYKTMSNREITDRMEDESMNKRDKAITSLINSNMLHYNLPPSLNVVNSTMFGDYISLGANTITPSKGCGKTEIVINSGELFGRPRSFALAFEVNVSGAEAGGNASQAASFANSAIDLIRGVRIVSHTGVEIFREDYINERVSTMEKYDNSWGGNRSTATLYGAPERGNDNTADSRRALPADQTKAKVVVPLYKFCGLFNSSTLLPWSILGGAKIYITWDPIVSRALQWAADPAVTDVYNIHCPRIIGMGVQLSDAILRAINKKSASSGLSYVFHSWEHLSDCGVTSSKVGLASKRALSRTVNVFSKIKSTATDTDADANSFLSFDVSQAGNSVDRWVYRYSGTLKPTCAVSCPAESFYHALNAFGKLTDTRKDCEVSQATFATRYGIFAQDLQRSDLVSLSGIPVNSSNQLTFEADVTAAAEYDVHLFLQYVTVLQANLQQIVVKL